MTDVLRGEFGFRGVVSSDFNLYEYMIPMQGAYAGTDLQLTWVGERLITDVDSAAGRTVIRIAVKNVAFALANSNAMQGVAPGSYVWYEMSPWRIWFYIGEAILGLACAGAVAWIIVRSVRVKRERRAAA